MMSVKWSLLCLVGFGFLLLCECQQNYRKLRLCISRRDDTTSCTLSKRRVNVYLPSGGSSQPGTNEDCFIIVHRTNRSTCRNKPPLEKPRCCSINADISGDSVDTNGTGFKSPVRFDPIVSSTSSISEQDTTTAIQQQTKTPEKTTLCKRPCENNGRCNNQGRCKCKSGYSGKFCEKVTQKSINIIKTKDDLTPQIWALLAGIFIGICIGVIATSVVCCCLAESVVGCRNRIRGCRLCQADAVIVQRHTESAEASSTRRDVRIEDISIYNEADDINTPRLGRPESAHNYEKIRVRQDPSRYDIMNNGIPGEIAICGTSIVKKKELTGSKVENSIELEEMAKIDDEILEKTSTDANISSINNTTAAYENIVIANPSPFYFTLAKVDNATASSSSRTVHIADDTQCPDEDRLYFILEKEIDDSAMQHVSITTDHMKHGNVDDVQSECAGTDASENNTTHIECVEDK